MSEGLRVPAEDLDEASIFLYRIWARALLQEDPEALVLREPEYVVVGGRWALFCSRSPADPIQVGLVGKDTGKTVICVAPGLPGSLAGLDSSTGVVRGSDQFQPVLDALVRAARELPEASKDRDPRVGRWLTRKTGVFGIWVGRQARLICAPAGEKEFGYTWDPSKEERYLYRSRSCKREGERTATGRFKLSEQKRDSGRIVWNLDLLSEDKARVALLRLVPAGAGYKAFARQIPTSMKPLAPIT